MNQDQGASAKADRAATPAEPSQSNVVSGKAGIPCAKTTTFDDLNFGPHHGDGKRARVSFENGYGASVVQSQFSYGGPEGLYELAVFTKDGLCYDTPITSDVEGHLTPEAVTDLLARIEALPARVSA